MNLGFQISEDGSKEIHSATTIERPICMKNSLFEDKYRQTKAAFLHVSHRSKLRMLTFMTLNQRWKKIENNQQSTYYYSDVKTAWCYVVNLISHDSTLKRG